jgi:hypothetical protein
MFEDVCWVGATVQALEKATPLAHATAVFDHAWQPSLQAVVKAWNLI